RLTTSRHKHRRARARENLHHPVDIRERGGIWCQSGLEVVPFLRPPKLRLSAGGCKAEARTSAADSQGAWRTQMSEQVAVERHTLQEAPGNDGRRRGPHRPAGRRLLLLVLLACAGVLALGAGSAQAFQ